MLSCNFLLKAKDRMWPIQKITFLASVRSENLTNILLAGFKEEPVVAGERSLPTEYCIRGNSTL